MWKYTGTTCSENTELEDVLCLHNIPQIVKIFITRIIREETGAVVLQNRKCG